MFHGFSLVPTRFVLRRNHWCILTFVTSDQVSRKMNPVWGIVRNRRSDYARGACEFPIFRRICAGTYVPPLADKSVDGRARQRVNSKIPSTPFSETPTRVMSGLEWIFSQEPSSIRLAV